MIDTAAIQEKAAKGARYQELLQSSDILDALTSIEKQYADELLNCFDAAQRDNLWRAVQVVRKVKAHLNQLASDGKVATYQLAEMKRLK